MQVEASHILVADLNTAVTLKRKVTNGEDFSSIAQQHSLCPSRANGGSLGAFGPGMMVPEFEQATFALPVGQVSDPVQTQFGWHLIHRTA